MKNIQGDAKYSLLQVLAELRGLGAGKVVMSQGLAQDMMGELERLFELDDILYGIAQSEPDEAMSLISNLLKRYKESGENG